MTDRKKEPTFGYLCVASLATEEQAAEGPWVGGYLIVTAAGRPLEFHCTAPVVASRAQQILYGKSLRPFIFGEHLGATLVAKAKLKPTLLLISDADSATAGRRSSGSDFPTVCLGGDAAAEAPVGAAELDGIEAAAWLLSRDTSADRQASVVKALQTLAASVDLAEPFERIHEAISEAQQGVAPTQPEQEASLRDAA